MIRACRRCVIHQSRQPGPQKTAPFHAPTFQSRFSAPASAWLRTSGGDGLRSVRDRHLTQSSWLTLTSPLSAVK